MPVINVKRQLAKSKFQIRYVHIRGSKSEAKLKRGEMMMMKLLLLMFNSDDMASLLMKY